MWYIPKKPYKAWKINISDFPAKKSFSDQIKYLIRYAVLAPSTFNTQPWVFSIKKNSVTISPDLKRKLLTSDRNDRLLYISTGCAVKNFEISARVHGFDIDKTYENKPKYTQVTLSLSKNGKNTDKKALINILSRLTNRNPYTNKQLSSKTISRLKNIAKNNGVNFKIISDEKGRNKIMKLAERGDLVLWGDKNFLSEHLQWIRNNLTRKYDGMPAFTVQISLVPSIFAGIALKNINFAKMQAKKNHQLLSTTPHFGFIVSKGNSREEWIKSGEALEEIWLYLNQVGASLAPQAQVIAVPELLKDLKTTLKTELQPQFFFRIGFATKHAYHSPRRPVHEVLK